MLVCMECWEVYAGSGGGLDSYQRCPKRACMGKLADIDELMLPAIILLNEKGYYTQYCCSGHFVDGERASAYIFFEDFVDGKAFKTIPRGFKKEKDEAKGLIIRRKFKAKVPNARHREALETSRDVLDWAERLKPLEE